MFGNFEIFSFFNCMKKIYLDIEHRAYNAHGFTFDLAESTEPLTVIENDMGFVKIICD